MNTFGISLIIIGILGFMICTNIRLYKIEDHLEILGKSVIELQHEDSYIRSIVK